MKNIKYVERELTRNDIELQMELPFAYLKVRAEYENVGFDLKLEYFIQNFEKGVREFNGVNLNSVGFPIFDLQEPKKGFLNSFICWHFFLTDEREWND